MPSASTQVPEGRAGIANPVATDTIVEATADLVAIHKLVEAVFGGSWGDGLLPKRLDDAAWRVFEEAFGTEDQALEEVVDVRAKEKLLELVADLQEQWAVAVAKEKGGDDGYMSERRSQSVSDVRDVRLDRLFARIERLEAALERAGVLRPARPSRPELRVVKGGDDG